MSAAPNLALTAFLETAYAAPFGASPTLPSSLSLYFPDKVSQILDLDFQVSDIRRGNHAALVTSQTPQGHLGRSQRVKLEFDFDTGT
jgi:hypothetical protein